MSASERLKALDHRAVLPADVAEMLLYRSLPHIVAVVEAAEKRTPHHDYWEGEGECPVCAALSALEEALSPASLSDQAFDELEQERERIEGTFGG